MNIYTPLKEREKHFIKRLNDKFPSFEYVCGYEHSDKPVLLRCKICGYEFERTAQVVRHNKKLICIHCDEIYRDNKRVEKEIDKQIKRLLKQQEMEIKKFYLWLKRNTLHIKHCKYCGEEILTDNKNKTMCICCYHKRNKKHSTKSLQKLYKRDKGICYICGGKCNYEDYIVRDGTIICGDYYPSIEHVIPLCKGGTDNWDNIRLAHRKCNNIKGDKQIV